MATKVETLQGRLLFKAVVLPWTLRQIMSYPKTSAARSLQQLKSIVRDIKRALAESSLRQFKPADTALALTCEQ